MSIRIADDELIPDEDLAREWQTNTRTLRRYDNEPDGLPFVLLAGRKLRPIDECRDWLARRVRRPNPSRAK